VVASFFFLETVYSIFSALSEKYYSKQFCMQAQAKRDATCATQMRGGTASHSAIDIHGVWAKLTQIYFF